MSLKQGTIAVESLLEEPKLKNNDPAVEKRNVIYRWTRDAANERAKKDTYFSIGTFSYDNKGVKTAKQASQKRFLHTAKEKVWYPTDKTEDQRKKNLNSKKGPEVRFVGAIPLQAFVKVFPEVYKPTKGSDVDYKAAKLNIFLSGMPADIVKALRFRKVFPASISDADAQNFIDRFAFYPAVLRESMDGEANPEYDEARRNEFDRLAASSVKKHTKADERSDIAANDVKMFNLLAKQIHNPFTKASNVDVLDVNGMRLCSVGEVPVGNVRNIVASRLDEQPIEKLVKYFSPAGKKNLSIKHLTVDRSATVNFVNRASPDEEEGEKRKETYSRSSQSRPFKLPIVYVDVEGNEHKIRDDFFWADKKAPVGVFINELKNAVRKDGSHIFKFDSSQIASTKVAFDHEIDSIKKKEPKQAAIRSVKEKDLSDNKKKKKTEEKEPSVEESNVD